MSDWIEAGCNEYLKRMPSELNLEIIELPMGHRGKGADLQRAIAREGEVMLKAIGMSDQVIALDIHGKYWSTEQLAINLDQWQLSGDNFSLLVGGPDGLAQDCIKRANSQCQSNNSIAQQLLMPDTPIIVSENIYIKSVVPAS